MTFKTTAVLAATMLAASASTAFAHTGVHTSAGFMAGFSHPLMGADHLLAMVAVGLWAGAMGGRAIWLVPASFVAAMAIGGGLGIQGLGLPGVELGITLSVIVLGALVALNPSLPLAAAMSIAATFAVFHGHAHGTEMAANTNAITYGLGFMLATASLHGVGIAAVVALKRRLTPTLLRVTGGAVGAAGLALLAG